MLKNVIIAFIFFIFHSFLFINCLNAKSKLDKCLVKNYEVITKTSCNAKIIFSNGAEYDGEFKNSCPHGFGVLKYDNGDIYTGKWENCNHHGKGVFTSYDGIIYDGDFVNGKKTGFAIITYPGPDGIEYYEGNMNDGRYHGKGKITYSDGLIGIGYWEYGEFKGWEKRLN